MFLRISIKNVYDYPWLERSQPAALLENIVVGIVMLGIAMAVDLTTALLALRELQIYADTMEHANPLLKLILLENLFDFAGESRSIATLYLYAVSKYIYGVAAIAISALFVFYAYRLARERSCTYT